MPKQKMNDVDKTANIRRLKDLTSTLIQEALAKIRQGRHQSSMCDDNRFRTAEYFLLEAGDRVNGAWEMLLIGNARASLAISRWTLEAALNLLWVVSNPDKINQRLTDLVGEALRQDANLREGLAKMWPHRAAALTRSANKARQIRAKLGVVRTTTLDEMMKETKPPDKREWPDLYVHYRVCCAAAHPGLKVWERFTADGQTTISTKPSVDTILTSDMAMWMAVAPAFWLVSFAYSLTNHEDAGEMKEWWSAKAAPLLGN
jgi:hypothetical protein